MNKYRFYAAINALFIFAFLNVWDYVVNKGFFNAMLLGVFFFGLIFILWLFGKFWAAILATLLSLLEFLMLVVFVGEGYELGGTQINTKTIFWVPFLLMAGLNLFWGLRIYSKYKKARIQQLKLNLNH